MMIFVLMRFELACKKKKKSWPVHAVCFNFSRFSNISVSRFFPHIVCLCCFFVFVDKNDFHPFLFLATYEDHYYIAVGWEWGVERKGFKSHLVSRVFSRLAVTLMYAIRNEEEIIYFAFCLNNMTATHVTINQTNEE